MMPWIQPYGEKPLPLFKSKKKKICIPTDCIKFYSTQFQIRNSHLSFVPIHTKPRAIATPIQTPGIKDANFAENSIVFFFFFGATQTFVRNASGKLNESIILVPKICALWIFFNILILS